MEKVRYIISDAAQMINVESHVLRYWEEELELQVPRNELGHRYYTQENIEQFQKIKGLKEKGYQLKAIKMILQEDKPVSLPKTPEVLETKNQPKDKLPAHVPKAPVPIKQPVIQVTQTQPALRQAVPVNTRPANTAGTDAQQRMEQFQNMMTGIVKKAIEENNQALGSCVSEQVGEKVLKEMNYLVREQEEMAQEHYRKLDEAIRQQHRSKKLFRKEKTKDKSLQPKTT